VERGSLDFDFPEPYITMDPHGRPIDIQKRVRLESHRLIEDFMLLANESVARFMSKEPFLYRIHESPDKTKFENLKKTLDAVGLTMSRDANLADPKTLQRVIGLTEDRPVQPIVQMMILRSLKQAIYTPINKGHFGLASACYTHFTSPIRRYPDLIVHRIVRDRLRHKLTPERKNHWEKEVPRIALHSSKRERVAVDAERDYTGLQKVNLMKERIGSDFTATITGVAAFGFFVQLNEVFVEGMVPVATLDDFYIFDEVRMRFIGRRSGRKFWIGQKVQVRLVEANPLKRQLEFQLVSAEGHTAPPRSASKSSPSQKHPPRPGAAAPAHRQQGRRRRRPPPKTSR
jgi:ribonuclease R